MGIKLDKFSNFHLRFFCLFFAAADNFSACKLSLVGTLKATPRSWWKAIQNAHFLPASGLWSKRRENKRAVEMEEYEGRKGRKKPATCISSTCLGSQQTCKWEWHIWPWCKEAQLQIKYIMGDFIQSSRSRPPFGFLLQNHHSQSVGMKKCLQDLEFVAGYFSVLSGLAGCWSHPWALPEYPGQIWPTCRDKKRCTTDKRKEQSALSATSGYEYWLLELSL